MQRGCPAKKLLLQQEFPLRSEPDGFGVLAECLLHIFRHRLLCRSTACLSFVERKEIALECARGTGVRAIARKLGRSPSTISREIRRNSATRSGEFDYRASAAQWHADHAARRPKISKLAVNPVLRDYVQERFSGLIATPDGIGFEGPVVVWKGRRAVLRQSRRWSSA